jgi:hypothetical protein
LSKSISVGPSSVDHFIESYVGWREACEDVSMAYAGWLRAPRSERALAFAGYQAALEREDLAAHAHREVQRGLETHARG